MVFQPPFLPKIPKDRTHTVKEKDIVGDRKINVFFKILIVTGTFIHKELYKILKAQSKKFRKYLTKWYFFLQLTGFFRK